MLVMQPSNFLVFKLRYERVKCPLVQRVHLNLERRDSLAAQLSHVRLAIDDILHVEEHAVGFLSDFSVLDALLICLHARWRHRLARRTAEVFHPSAS